jgi:hypothetical protein
MAPFVKAARPTSKAKVLGTLPKRPRHLTVVPPLPPEESESEPEESGQNAPETHKGESVDALSEPEGLLVPESPPKPLDSVPGSQAVRPALSLAPPAGRTPAPPEWAEFAPARGDDMQSRVFKTRKWATAMGCPANKTLGPKMFAKWEEWYREERWNNIE